MSKTKGKPEMPETAPTENVKYELAAREPDGSLRHAIAMSREEFTAMNEHLIAIRGYRKEQELHQLTTRGLPGYNLDEEQAAAHLETARDLYEEFPSLVVAEEMPPSLEKMLQDLRKTLCT